MLGDYVAATQATYRAAQSQPLTKEQLRAGIEQHRAVLLAERTGRALGPAPPTARHAFLDHFDSWIAKEEQPVSVRTDTFWTHWAVRKEPANFADHRKQPDKLQNS